MARLPPGSLSSLRNVGMHVGQDTEPGAWEETQSQLTGGRGAGCPSQEQTQEKGDSLRSGSLS